LSDHLPSFFISGKKLSSISNKYVVKCYRDVRNWANLETLKLNLSEFDWSLYPTSSDANAAYDEFMSALSSIYNTSFLIIKKTHKPINYCKPWITSAILKSIRKKNSLYKKWLSKKTDYCLITYKNYKNKLTKVIRSSEKLYYENQFANLKDNIKGTWSLIKRIISDTGKIACTNNIDELLISGKIIKDKLLMANKFNEYFTIVGSSLAAKIPTIAGDFSIYVNNGQSVSQSFLAQSSDPTEIINIVNQFKPNKSAGYDDIHPSVIINVIPFIAQPISNIVNLSLSTGTFPDWLKIAKVVPIFKNDDKKLIT
jgi:hypothetical protein